MKRWILSFAVRVALWVAAAHAHHSIAGAYDTNRQVTVEGIVMEFHFVNPHPFARMQVKMDSGSAQQWRLERAIAFARMHIKHLWDIARLSWLKSDFKLLRISKVLVPLDS